MISELGEEKEKENEKEEKEEEKRKNKNKQQQNERKKFLQSCLVAIPEYSQIYRLSLFAG